MRNTPEVDGLRSLATTEELEKNCERTDWHEGITESAFSVSSFE
jgi:hypothetical protein